MPSGFVIEWKTPVLPKITRTRMPEQTTVKATESVCVPNHGTRATSFWKR